MLIIAKDISCLFVVNQQRFGTTLLVHAFGGVIEGNAFGVCIWASITY